MLAVLLLLPFLFRSLPFEPFIILVDVFSITLQVGEYQGAYKVSLA